jgi:hypothetical protein
MAYSYAGFLLSNDVLRRPVKSKELVGISVGISQVSPNHMQWVKPKLASGFTTQQQA